MFKKKKPIISSSGDIGYKVKWKKELKNPWKWIAIGILIFGVVPLSISSIIISNIDTQNNKKSQQQVQKILSDYNDTKNQSQTTLSQTIRTNLLALDDEYNLNPSSQQYQTGFEDAINTFANSKTNMERLWNSSISDAQYTEINDFLQTYKDTANIPTIQSQSSTFSLKTNLSTTTSTSTTTITQEVKEIIANIKITLNNLTYDLQNQINIIGGIIGGVSTVLGILAFFTGGATALVTSIISATFGTVMGIMSNVISSIKAMVTNIENNLQVSSSLIYDTTQLQVLAEEIQNNINQLNENLNSLSGTEWIIGVNDAKTQIQTSITSLQNVYNEVISTIEKINNQTTATIILK